MSFRLNARDCQVLHSVAEYRALTAHHLTVLHQRDSNALRRRLRELDQQGLVRIEARLSPGRRGRPDGLVSLTEDGVAALRSEGGLSQDIPSSQVTAEGFRCIDHLLLANDFRVQLVQMQRVVPAVAVRYLSPISPFLERTADDHSAVHESFPDENGKWVEYTPDGVFALTHDQVPQALLFFLEVDMGTEALNSAKRPRQDVEQKVLNYQATYRLQRYRRRQQVLGHEFRGFRLLFLASDLGRAGALCRLVREMPPSSFIYVTDRGSLELKGVWADIWVQGGRLDVPRQSILGSKRPNPSPAPSDLA